MSYEFPRLVHRYRGHLAGGSGTGWELDTPRAERAVPEYPLPPLSGGSAGGPHEPGRGISDQKDWLQCDNEVDIQAGDELIIHRGAVLGKSIPDIRAFASGPNHFFDPFGAIMPGLAHQEIRLLQQERVKGGVEDEPGGAHKAAQTG